MVNRCDIFILFIEPSVRENECVIYVLERQSEINLFCYKEIKNNILPTISVQRKIIECLFFAFISSRYSDSNVKLSNGKLLHHEIFNALCLDFLGQRNYFELATPFPPQPLEFCKHINNYFQTIFSFS